MQLIERFVTAITYVVSILTFSSVNSPGLQHQNPLVPSHGGRYNAPRGPIFRPPGGYRDSDFQCDYSNMPGFTSCSTAENRSCWLRNSKTGSEYNINTNYEDTNLTPVGVHRTYYLNITDTAVNADGLNFPYGKLFNSTYPGPWIQACWGDNVTVVVQNKLKHNGTSVHWHGIRQWLTMHIDGVNGVTQCPIAPGDSFNYTWRAMQYGSSWYHSHYSVQYADGSAGPITLHGPTSEPFDEPKLPILMTDWGHNSAFEASFTKLADKSILLNGVGNVTRYLNTQKAQLPVPDPYRLTFERPAKGTRAKRYLLRLINTSFDSTFVFSIDGHILEIVQADFVPIKSYTNTSVLVGIGQRYNVIVTALSDPKEDAYWIRTYKANCFRFNGSDPKQVSPGYEKSSVLHYGDAEGPPTSQPWIVGKNVSLDCSDETYSSLTPKLPWTVGPPKNDPSGLGQNFTVLGTSHNAIYPQAFFSMGGDNFNPLRIDHGDPTFMHLDNDGVWNANWVVVNENSTDKDWVGRSSAATFHTSNASQVYLAIQGNRITRNTFGAHPVRSSSLFSFLTSSSVQATLCPSHPFPMLSSPWKPSLISLDLT